MRVTLQLAGDSFPVDLLRVAAALGAWGGEGAVLDIGGAPGFSPCAGAVASYARLHRAVVTAEAAAAAAEAARPPATRRLHVSCAELWTDARAAALAAACAGAELVFEPEPEPEAGRPQLLPPRALLARARALPVLRALLQPTSTTSLPLPLPDVPREALRAAWFVALHGDPAGSPGARAFLRDSLRHAVAHSRARRCSRPCAQDVHLVVLVQDPQSALRDMEPVHAALRHDPRVWVHCVHMPDHLAAARAMAACEMGGLLCPPSGFLDGEPDVRALRALGVEWAVAAAALGDFGEEAAPGEDDNGGEEDERLFYVPGRALAAAAAAGAGAGAEERRGADADAGLRAWRRDGDTFVDCGPPPSAACVAKLRGAPPVYWINMARCASRREHMERLLRAHGLAAGATRVDAVDASDARAYAARVRPHGSGSPGENCATASHLLALARFLAEAPPDAPHALVLEDDVTLEFAERWPRALAQYLRDARPAGWEVLQLCGIVCDRADLLGPGARVRADRAVPRAKDNWFSAAAYVVTRAYARRLVGHYLRGGPVLPGGGGDWFADLAGGCAPGDSVHAEPLLFTAGRHCAAPLFLPLFGYLATDSDIHADNPVCHAVAKGYLRQFWRRAATAPVDAAGAEAEERVAP